MTSVCFTANIYHNDVFAFYDFLRFMPSASTLLAPSGRPMSADLPTSKGECLGNATTPGEGRLHQCGCTRACMSQIEKRNNYLKAVLAAAPDAIGQARRTG